MRGDVVTWSGRDGCAGLGRGWGVWDTWILGLSARMFLKRWLGVVRRKASDLYYYLFFFRREKCLSGSGRLNFCSKEVLKGRIKGVLRDSPP